MSLFELMSRFAIESQALFDERGALIYANPQFRREYDVADATNLTVAQLFPTLDMGVICESSRVMEGSPSQLIETFGRRNGSDFPVELRLQRIQDQDRDVIFISARDTSERLRLREQLQQSDTADEASQNVVATPRRTAVEGGKLLRQTLDSLFAFAGVCLPDGTLVEANQVALQAANLKPEDVLGRPFPDTYWFAYSYATQKQLEAAICRAAHGETVRYDVDVRIGPDTFITIDFQITPICDEEGIVTHLIPSAIDVTERRRAEARLLVEHQVTQIIADDDSTDRAIRRILQTFVDQLQVDLAEYWSFSESGNCLTIHQQVMGSSLRRGKWNEHRQQLAMKKGQGLPGILWVEGKPAWMSNASSEFAHLDDTVSLAGLRTAYGIPIRSGETFFGAFCFFSRQNLSADDALLSMLTAIGQEVGQLMVRLLNESALQLRDRAISKATNGIVIVDAQVDDLPVIYVNRGFEQITGYSASEVTGKNCRFLQGTKTDRNSICKLRNAIRSRAQCHVCLANYRKDGSLFWNDLTISPISDDQGRITHFVGILNDVSERKAIEQQLRAAERRARIDSDLQNARLHHVGQELRHPIELILESTQALNRVRKQWPSETLPSSIDSFQQLVSTVERQAVYAQGLLHEIDILSRSSHSRPNHSHSNHPRSEHSLQTLNLHSFVLDLEGLMADRAKSRGLHLKISTQDPLPHRIRCDRQCLQRLLVELVSTSIRFAKQGGIQISVEVMSSPNDADDASRHTSLAATSLAATSLAAQSTHRVAQPTLVREGESSSVDCSTPTSLLVRISNPQCSGMIDAIQQQHSRHRSENLRSGPRSCDFGLNSSMFHELAARLNSTIKFEQGSRSSMLLSVPVKADL